MFEVITLDGRPVTLERTGDDWVRLTFISTHGITVRWGVPAEFLAEFLQGLAESYENYASGEDDA